MTKLVWPAIASVAFIIAAGFYARVNDTNFVLVCCSGAVAAAILALREK